MWSGSRGNPSSPESLKVFNNKELGLDFDCKVLKTKDLYFKVFKAKEIGSSRDRVGMGVSEVWGGRAYQDCSAKNAGGAGSERTLSRGVAGSAQRVVRKSASTFATGDLQALPPMDAETW